MVTIATYSEKKIGVKIFRPTSGKQLIKTKKNISAIEFFFNSGRLKRLLSFSFYFSYRSNWFFQFITGFLGIFFSSWSSNFFLFILRRFILGFIFIIFCFIPFGIFILFKFFIVIHPVSLIKFFISWVWIFNFFILFRHFFIIFRLNYIFSTRRHRWSFTNIILTFGINGIRYFRFGNILSSRWSFILSFSARFSHILGKSTNAQKHQ